MTEQADPNNLVLNPKNVNRSTSFGFEPKDVLRRGDGYTILDAKLDNMITSGHHAHVWGGFGSTCRVPPGTYLSDDGSLVTTKNSNIIINHGGKITNMGAHVANICGECTNVRGRTDNYFGTVHNAEGFVVNNGGRVNNFRGYVENNLGAVSNYHGDVLNKAGDVQNQCGRVRSHGGRVLNDAGQVASLGGLVDNYQGNVTAVCSGVKNRRGVVHGYACGIANQMGLVTNEDGHCINNKGFVRNSNGFVANCQGVVHNLRTSLPRALATDRDGLLVTNQNDAKVQGGSGGGVGCSPEAPSSTPKSAPPLSQVSPPRAPCDPWVSPHQLSQAQPSPCSHCPPPEDEKRESVGSHVNLSNLEAWQLLAGADTLVCRSHSRASRLPLSPETGSLLSRRIQDLMRVRRPAERSGPCYELTSPTQPSRHVAGPATLRNVLHSSASSLSPTPGTPQGRNI